jgi:hypothetical protein
LAAISSPIESRDRGVPYALLAPVRVTPINERPIACRQLLFCNA